MKWNILISSKNSKIYYEYIIDTLIKRRLVNQGKWREINFVYVTAELS